MGIITTVETTPIDAAPAEAPHAPKRQRGMISQVNARIESTTKREADAAFAGAGIAPSEAIRALYVRAATLGSSLRTVDDLVVSDVGTEAQRTREAAFEHATHAFDDMLTRYGFSVDLESIMPLTEEEIEEAFYQDYLAGGAL